MQDNHDTPDASRMHDYDGEVLPDGCYPGDKDFAMQLAAALIRGAGLAARDGWRALTGRPPGVVAR